jgi:hypothetical protein
MKVHRFILIFFTAGLLVFSVNYFLMQRKFDMVTIGGALIYVVGVITSIIGYFLARNKKKKQDLMDSLP